MTWPNLLFSACQRFSQSQRTSFFSRQSYWSSGLLVHSSTQSLCLAPGVSASSSVWLAAWRFVQHRILVRIVLHASLIFWAIPERSSRAWNLATCLFSQRSNGGTYDSVSSMRIGVALYAPSTICNL